MKEGSDNIHLVHLRWLLRNSRLINRNLIIPTTGNIPRTDYIINIISLQDIIYLYRCINVYGYIPSVACLVLFITTPYKYILIDN